MSEWDKEAFYDEQIAPRLLEVSKLCQDNGMSIIAVADYNSHGDYGATVSLAKASPRFLRYLHLAIQCREETGINIDKFMLAVMKDARGKPHSSLILSQLGVPTTPEKEPTHD